MNKEMCAFDDPETTRVQTIFESRSRIGLERFQRTLNLVVLFTRSQTLQVLKAMVMIVNLPYHQLDLIF